MRNRPTLLLVATFVSVSTLTHAQGSPTSQQQTLDSGLQQLAAARATRSEAALGQAEAAFRKVLAQEPNNARALVHLGEVELFRGGRLAAQGQFGPATELIQSGIADMNRAVGIAPDQIEIRLTRGLSYAPFPAFYNLESVAREDLESTTRHPEFTALSQEVQDRVSQGLSRLQASATRAASHPDRFPSIASTLSPVIAVASVTFPDTRDSDRPAWLDPMMADLKDYPGLLGSHTVVSLDHPGMVVIFTWWKDKQALNDFYYSDVHQRFMNGRGQSITGERKTSGDEAPSQVAVEILSALPGGMQLNGGFVPREVRGQK